MNIQEYQRIKYWSPEDAYKFLLYWDRLVDEGMPPEDSPTVWDNEIVGGEQSR